MPLQSRSAETADPETWGGGGDQPWRGVVRGSHVNHAGESRHGAEEGDSHDAERPGQPVVVDEEHGEGRPDDGAHAVAGGQHAGGHAAPIREEADDVTHGGAGVHDAHAEAGQGGEPVHRRERLHGTEQGHPDPEEGATKEDKAARPHILLQLAGDDRGEGACGHERRERQRDIRRRPAEIGGHRLEQHAPSVAEADTEASQDAAGQRPPALRVARHAPTPHRGWSLSSRGPSFSSVVTGRGRLLAP